MYTIKLSYLHNLDKFDTKTKVFSKDQIDVKISKPGITSLLSQKRLDGDNHKLNAPKIMHFGLSDTEKKVYGNRWPAGYTKIRVLGRGGWAIVWLAKENGSDELVALKQFPKKQISIGSAKVEKDIFDVIMDSNISHKGHKYISHLMEKINEKRDWWLVYELGGDSLSKMLFEVKGEFHNGERIYFINHQNFYFDIKKSKNLMRQFIQKLTHAFDLLQQQGIVHADVKSDNILVSYTEDTITCVKLIDFGSAFLFETTNSIAMSTPEYLAPEILDYLENKGKPKYSDGVPGLLNNMHVWSYDMWSIGALLLEIMTGFPLWLSLKGRQRSIKGKNIFGMGIFGVQGRDWKKIYQKQKKLLNHGLKNSLKKYDCNGYDNDCEFMDLLSNLLNLNPCKRLSPQQVLNHPFISDYIDDL
jgi:dual specificity tyrosine-phosphorylation-regulated kinase 2/3/4